MEEYIVKDGKKLRLGYTTGSCAAAAAKAATWMLLSGRRKERISLLTPKGIRLELSVEEIQMEADAVSCAIRKDSGDDPDATRGTLVFARARRTDAPGVTIDGGQGVGRVTKRGLDQPVGAAAINSVPRRMIRENVEEVCRALDYPGGIEILVSVPEGEALARKTFNPRLGIVGGISILGTTGIVEPMSEQALVDTIRVELRQRRESGADYVLLTPGNYGADFIRGKNGSIQDRHLVFGFLGSLGKGVDGLGGACYVGCAGHESGLADEVFPDVGKACIRQGRTHEVVLGYVALSAAGGQGGTQIGELRHGDRGVVHDDQERGGVDASGQVVNDDTLVRIHGVLNRFGLQFGDGSGVNRQTGAHGA